MANTLSLNAIKAINICDGGWQISLSAKPEVAPGQAILLEVGATCTVDITDGFTKPHMVLILEALAQQELWARPVSCRALHVEMSGGRTSRATNYYSLNNWGQSSVAPVPQRINVLAVSSDRTLQAPVKPYCPPNPVLTYGRAALGQLGHAAPRIIYKFRLGDAGQEVGDGRFLTIAYNKRHYFMNQYPRMNTPFVTKNEERGFDCTTYILTAYHVEPNYKGGRGDDVANCLSARDCNVSGWTGEQARTFFQSNQNGEFVMWSQGHVVMVVDGFVHEFTTDGVYGYRCTAIDAYLAARAQRGYSVMALPGTNFVPVAKPAPPAKGKTGGTQPGQGQQPGGGIGIGPTQPGGSLPPTGGGGQSYIPNQRPGGSLPPTTQQPAGGNNLYTSTGGMYGKKPG